MKVEPTDQVKRRYDQLFDLAHRYAERKGHYGMRHGYYDEGHSSEAEAIGNLRKKMLEETTIESNDRVLDLGCGFGEDATWMAKHRGAEVVGVDINEDEISVAKQLAEDRDVDEKVDFRIDDFHSLESVSESSIDVVWCAEALAHSHDDRRVISEIDRVLKDGGRVVVADVFLRSRESEADDRVEEFVDLSLIQIEPLDEFLGTFQKRGYSSVDYSELTEGVLPQMKHRYRMNRLLWLPISRVKRLLFRSERSRHELELSKGQIQLYDLVRDDVILYAVVSATRPE